MSGPRKKPNSGTHVFLKNCSSGTDQRLLDADFDRYWDDESKNNNRNRIRVGRQYQATVPPLLKPGEADGRRCEDLETLKWKPDQEISDEQLDNYLSVVKAVSLFAKAIDIYQNPDSETGKCLQNALRGLSEFVTSHHPSESESGCQVSASVDQSSSGGAAASSATSGHQNRSSPGWSFAEGSLFLKALDVCGKNFAAIKKDFLPWKPVRNLIEYYYCGQKSDQQQQPGVVGSNGPRRSSSTSSGQDSSSSAPLSNSVKTLPGQATSSETVVKKEGDETAAVENLPTGCVPVPEDAPLPLPTSVDEENDTVGSLKFYLGGQMVLKLNARQESSGGGGGGGEGPRCQWVQSKDNCLKPLPTVRKKRRKRQVNGERHNKSALDHRSSGSGSDSDNCWLSEMAKRKMPSPCCAATTVVSPKPAWTPPVEKNIKCNDSPLQEDKTGLRGS